MVSSAGTRRPETSRSDPTEPERRACGGFSLRKDNRIREYNAACWPISKLIYPCRRFIPLHGRTLPLRPSPTTAKRRESRPNGVRRAGRQHRPAMPPINRKPDSEVKSRDKRVHTSTHRSFEPVAQKNVVLYTTFFHSETGTSVFCLAEASSAL